MADTGILIHQIKVFMNTNLDQLEREVNHFLLSQLGKFENPLDHCTIKCEVGKSYRGEHGYQQLDATRNIADPDNKPAALDYNNQDRPDTTFEPLEAESTVDQFTPNNRGSLPDQDPPVPDSAFGDFRFPATEFWSGAATGYTAIPAIG
jgi:hypothetical protein